MARARQRLNELTSTEWPAWYQTSVEPKILDLENRIDANVFQLLRGPWVFTCNQCGTRAEDEFTAGEIERLLKTGQIKVACANPECGRHTFQVFLHELVEARIVG